MSFLGRLGSQVADAAADVRSALIRFSGVDDSRITVQTSGRLVIACTSPGQILVSGNVTAVFRGILFDREALPADLHLVSGTPEAADAALLIAAFRKWDVDFPIHLDGEFSYLVYDDSRKLLMAGRDVMGRGSIHFSRVGETLLFAEEPAGLFAMGLPARVDDRHLTAVGTMQLRPGRTWYEAVSYPPAGQLLLVEQGQPEKLVRYWLPEEQQQLRLPDTAAYAEALHAALRRAVAIRLPRTGTVATELSSGYDSSAVTALAAEILAAQNRTLIAYTSRPAQISDASTIIDQGIADEWPLASLVAARHSNIEHVPVRTAAAPWSQSLDGMTQMLNGPPLFIRNMPWMYAARQMAQQRGVSVVLNGQNGNLTGSYDGAFALFDMRRRGKWRLLASTLQQWHALGAGWKSLAMRTWNPSTQVRSHCRRFLGRPGTSFAAHSLLRADFVRSTGGLFPSFSTIGLPIDGDRTHGAARRFSIMQMVDFGAQYAAERRLFGLQRSDPTADRRLVEFCLTVPDEVFCSGGTRRQLYREAMKTVLPAAILTDSGFGLQASDFLENFGTGMPDWYETLSRMENSPGIARRFDLPRLRSLLDGFPAAVITDRANADTIYNYAVGGTLAQGRFLLGFDA